MFAKGYFLRRKGMSRKELLIYEIARMYKGITVAEYAKRFGHLTTEQLERYIRLKKVVALQSGEMV
jgi:uncharacterized protein (DUF433 family)